MKQYINKAAVKAELEKCYNECLKRAKIIDSEYWNAKADAYCNALVILDETTEVKEVDLDDKDKWKNTGGFGSTWDPDSPDYYPD